ncbi:bifunctional phosphoribosylaminoimidazolecarboxamide formyltransferase/IMP cyclohydrolase [Candidatus Poribacteria bacterium]|jgi:phosphoribosylaminoimidazolecarboxamide formyltransferase / IMP cyclohydrolase|nr:bifunctional phosphoribosylaminoimidazolecarboxamide formyltransferase/IMP cyclohydrolase [Candidatus Poribacteria bacterium]MBT5714421.1 bifunctional phosphoribosylaminoimidazolecarboxamide formyltransferase/IMP cyclohydrolase [Candidatus Poribacteria bacterium]MBT7807568.1 bifunctional phosphoribosylaminoimidazolecarboxamide formyltransferase/IMP cyclohydrolase [Candidatus Poribacteria bacterium]
MTGIRRALISVSDKTGAADLARALSDMDVHILSTGGTATLLREAGVDVQDVSDYTGFPEMMDGRVKTLHPKIHGGILALRDDESHVAQAQANGVGFIDLVVSNLYPFRETIANPDVEYADAVENIDIGGPTLIRASAKNHAHVAILTDPSQYEETISALRQSGSLSDATRQKLAVAAFEHTAAYDGAIAAYLSAQVDEAESAFAPTVFVPMKRLQGLRYGENPHQSAAFYEVEGTNSPWGRMEQLAGEELSYNNILDADGAWSSACEFDEPTCAIIKHTNPCGLAVDDDLKVAFRRAFLGDPISAFGGIVSFNRPVTDEIARAVRAAKHPTSGARLLLHIIMAPDYEPAAVERLSKSRSLRVLKLPLTEAPAARYRSVEGGMLVQDADALVEDGDAWTCATARKPTDDELADLKFAWKCAKLIKSNAIVVAKNRTMLGMGAGQPNRVNSARLAVAQAGAAAEGAALASDALVPFLDTIAVGLAHGVRAFVQPGGAVRDDESTATADGAGATMLHTGVRHFRH